MKTLLILQLVTSGLFAAEPPPATQPEAVTAEPGAPKSLPAAPSTAQPLPLVLAGTATEYAPRVDFVLFKGLRVQVPVALASRFEQFGATPLDAAGTPSASGAMVSPLARLGVRLTGPDDWGPLTVLAEYEHDLPTGTVAGALPEGQAMPGASALTQQLRRASVRVGYGNTLVAGGGVMTNHFGLGLMANDGAHGWEPGSARFADPRGGDRVLRGFLATGPHAPMGLVAVVALDKVLDDDTLLLAQEQGGSGPKGDDSAFQAVGTISVGRPTGNWAGLFAAYRNQRAADGRVLSVAAVSISGTGRRALTGGGVLSGGAEGSLIAGRTTLTATPSQPDQAVRGLALALRGGLDFGRWGLALDAVAASGDQNPDDASQNGFRADPNYELGLILFRQVLAAQSARGAFTAGNPMLVGTPAPGVERVPTQGSVTNTVAVFPRAFVRPMQGLEVYGGPLLAWTAVPLVDPFNTRLSGGSIRNALGAAPGGFLGAEVDLGVRARFLVLGSELSAGVEAGLLLPGDAFRKADRSLPAAVPGGRALLGFRL